MDSVALIGIIVGVAGIVTTVVFGWPVFIQWWGNWRRRRTIGRRRAARSKSAHTSPHVLNKAPYPPTWFVPRPTGYDKLLGLLLDADARKRVAITTALVGAGGFGKTTLAKALCHDPLVEEEFPDGILCVTLVLACAAQRTVEWHCTGHINASQDTLERRHSERRIRGCEFGSEFGLRTRHRTRRVRGISNMPKMKEILRLRTLRVRGSE